MGAVHDGLFAKRVVVASCAECGTVMRGVRGEAATCPSCQATQQL